LPADRRDHPGHLGPLLRADLPGHVTVDVAEGVGDPGHGIRGQLGVEDPVPDFPAVHRWMMVCPVERADRAVGRFEQSIRHSGSRMTISLDA